MKIFNHIFLTLLIVAGLAACGDNSTGPETDTPPEIPSFENVQPDFSFFNQNPPAGKQTSTSTTGNFNEARSTASIGGGYITAAFFPAAIFLLPLDRVDPEFVDGHWEWYREISSEEQGSVAMRLTVAEENGSNNWLLFISGDDGEGNSYENYKLMEGRTATDLKEGEWTFNVLEENNQSEVRLAQTSWQITDETEQEFTMDACDSDTGEVEATVYFIKDEPKFNMVITDFTFEDGPEQLIIEWNTDTNRGSLRDTEEGTTKCWDSNLQNTPC